MTVDPIPLRFESNKTRLPFHIPQEEPSSGISAPNSALRISIRSVRILCQLCVPSAGENNQIYDCVIDSGAPLSVFPHKCWSMWPEGTIEWLEPSDNNARRALGVRGVSSNAADARLGRVTVVLWNLDPLRPTAVIETRPFSIVAKFITTASTFNRVVFGMSGNAMDRWQKLVVVFQFESGSLE